MRNRSPSRTQLSRREGEWSSGFTVSLSKGVSLDISPKVWKVIESKGRNINESLQILRELNARGFNLCGKTYIKLFTVQVSPLIEVLVLLGEDDK